jgi:hypothetical protein
MADLDESDFKVGEVLKEEETTSPEPPLQVLNEPINIVYCPKCTWPPEFWFLQVIARFLFSTVFVIHSEFGQHYENECLPWILQNYPDLLGEKYLVEKLQVANIEGKESAEEGDDDEKDDVNVFLQ